MRVRLLCGFLTGFILCIEGCTRYHAMPITAAAVDDRLTTPSMTELRVKAGDLKHPILKPVALDDLSSIGPDQAAVLAVLINPSLRTARDQRQAAAAQSILAGILPNPQLSLSEDFPNGGADAGTVHPLGIGVSWDVSELLSQNAKIDAARSAASSVELDIAWQEWQVAEAAKAAVFDLLALQSQLELSREVDRSLAENAAIMRDALDRHERTVLDNSAAEAASLDAHTAVLTAQRDLRHQRLVLNRAIGLPPDADLAVRSDVALPSKLDLPSQEDLLADLGDRRLDLVALRRGYQSQEQTLRAAVLAQFPKLNLGFNGARDNTNVKSVGFGVTLDLPIFDRNQGVIATEKATRQRLFDEYTQRVFEARSDVATALDDIAAIEEELAATEAAVPSLQKLADTYKLNLSRGNVDVLSYYTALGNVAAKKIDVLKLKQDLTHNRVALEIATGQFLPVEAATTQPTTAQSTTVP